ncbi:hypothetical protein J6590_005684 [Homalodisca vitripennis]|nr:hypothetical protein J6590_005684 [Homalodisca vitripennis]
MGDVRMLVQEEGRAARNLVAFHVDLASPAPSPLIRLGCGQVLDCNSRIVNFLMAAIITVVNSSTRVS